MHAAPLLLTRRAVAALALGLAQPPAPAPAPAPAPPPPLSAPRPLLCVECRHFVLPDDVLAPLSLGRCGRAGAVDVVTGDVDLEFAARARAAGGPCGPEGRLHERADPVPDPAALRPPARPPPLEWPLELRDRELDRAQAEQAWGCAPADLDRLCT